MCLPPPFFLPVLLNAGDKGAQTFNLKNQTPGWIQIEYHLAEAKVILRYFQNIRCVLFQAWEWSTESCSKSLGQRASEWHGSKMFKEAPFLDGNTGRISFLVPTRMTFMPLVLSNSLLELIDVCMPVSTRELLFYPDVSFVPSPSNLVSDMNLQNNSFGFFLYLERETQLYISCIYRVRYLTVRWTTTGHTKGWWGGTGGEGYGYRPRGMGRWHSESCRIQMCHADLIS